MVMQGLSVLLDAEPGMDVINKVASNQELNLHDKRLKPEIIIINLSFNEDFRIKALRHLMEDNQNAKLIGITEGRNLQLIHEFIKVGASACLSYDCEFEELVEAINVVAMGGFHICPQISTMLINEFKMIRPKSSDDEWPSLTERERSILLELLGNKAIKEIASDLALSPNTIYVLKRRIMKKVGVKTIAELTKLAIRAGVVSV
jgi:DNA-binding NarL/FixJ family response regulator